MQIREDIEVTVTGPGGEDGRLVNPRAADGNSSREWWERDFLAMEYDGGIRRRSMEGQEKSDQ